MTMIGTDRDEAGSGMAERELCVGDSHFVIVGTNRAVLHAARWLQQFGCRVTGARSLQEARAISPAPLALLIAGDAIPADAVPDEGAVEIYLWDYEVDRPGLGDFASAVSGVSTVIGAPDGAPGVMPAKIPEKWAGLFGASLALSLKVARDTDAKTSPRRIDVSAADLLRAFAEQNSGNHAGVPYGWRRNGRTAIEHGGVFPQGFFRCRDGFMAVQARSRPDWHAVLAALDDPEWGKDPAFQNPFRLSEDDSKVLPLLDAELMKRDRRHLLERAMVTGAPIAPVLSLDEAKAWDVFRPAFFAPDGQPRPPFTVRRAKILETQTS
ncbi:CoA transferase [Sphingobium phenoxybenzoativorans]|uniref:CoA transferase n=1 Tax=Sphingobium phenoxybenzoativorans TaxID=1592790 RepID=UPI0009F6C8A4|nr:CoA transferase [Sphingobium phenoxybenzoativorans]